MTDWAGRPRAPYVADERAMLEGWLDFHRATLLWKCEGLTDEQLRTPSSPPSKLSLIALVRHMAEVERGWFADFVGSDSSSLYCSEDEPDGDLDNAGTADVAADLALLGREQATYRDACRSFSLDDVKQEDDHDISLRWIYLHMIEEYARHNGHADLIRERIDGATGD